MESKSKLDQYTINEEESRAIISKYCRNNHWKYRKMDWDNDIDGEIEIFDSSRETTAKFIKVQLKTVDDPKEFESLKQHYHFNIDPKFLHFCNVCDVPVILIVFNIHKGISYFLFVQKYIYEELDIKNPNWKNNSSSVTVKIPIDNSLQLDSAKAIIEDIGFKGVDVIAQLRKTETYKKYFSVLQQNDNSHVTALRSDIKIFIEKSFASSREAMRILIPKINEAYVEKVYYRNQVMASIHSNKKYDVIYLYFYDTLNQSNQGLPFCRTLWINNKLPEMAKPLVSKPDEQIGDINIYWDFAEQIGDFIENNLLDKGQYIPIIDKSFEEFQKLHKMVLYFSNEYKQGKIDSSEYLGKIESLSAELDKLNSMLFNVGFPPNECRDLDMKIRSLIAHLHDIRVATSDEKREVSNKLNLINISIIYIDEQLPEFAYERKKLK